MTINEVSRDCGRLTWREERIRSLDGTEIALCVADVPSVPEPSPGKTKTPIYVLYFQGRLIPLIVYLMVAYQEPQEMHRRYHQDCQICPG